MSATRVRAELRPVDTWHFGDGQPFAQADSGQAIARGLFPPLPSTCAGCVRLALAAAGGAVRGDWREQDRDEVVRLYGGGDALGSVRFVGPVLRDERGTAWFRTPQDLQDKDDGESAARSYRSADFVNDADGARLSKSVTKPLGGWCSARAADDYLKRDGRAKNNTREIASGEGMLRDGLGVTQEWRTGLQRYLRVRSAVPGMLYSQARQRPEAEMALDLHLENDDPIPLPAEPMVVPFGADGGLAELRFFEDPTGLPLAPFKPSKSSGEKLKLWLLTPAVVETAPRQGDTIALVADDDTADVEVLLAFMAKPTPFGGWSGTGTRRGPMARRLLLGAGTVLVVRVDGGIQRFAERRHLGVGERTEWGFGAAAMAEIVDSAAKGGKRKNKR